MSSWSANPFVSSSARAVEDQGVDGLEIMLVKDGPQVVGEWKSKRMNTKIGIAQNMGTARCFGDVPSKAVPNMLKQIEQGGITAKKCKEGLINEIID